MIIVILHISENLSNVYVFRFKEIGSYCFREYFIINNGFKCKMQCKSNC